MLVQLKKHLGGVAGISDHEEERVELFEVWVVAGDSVGEHELGLHKLDVLGRGVRGEQVLDLDDVVVFSHEAHDERAHDLHALR